MPKIAVTDSKLTPRGVIAEPVFEPCAGLPSALIEIIESLPEPACLLDRAHRWVYANRAYCDYMGRPRQALLGRTSSDVLAPSDAAAAWHHDETAFNTGEAVINESVVAENAVLRIVQTRKTVIRAGTDQTYLFAIVRDLTGTEDARELLRGAGACADAPEGAGNLGFGQVRFVFSDPLTQLPNRRATMNLIDTIASRATDDAAILVLNIDHFSLVNDRFGHGAGDAAMVEIGRRLRSAVGDGVVLGRLDNDEFIIVAEHCDAMHADLIAGRIGAEITEPIQFDDQDCRLSASIGIALMPEHGRSAEELIRNAALAMRRCKQRCRGGSERFCEVTNIAAQRRAHIELSLPVAVEAGHLSVHYQPFVDSESGKLRGFEALSRWQDATLGEVGPSEFIPVAERTGIIRQLGQNVITQACGLAGSFRSDALSVSVNVSSLQLLDETFPIFVAETLQRHAVTGEQLILEITETVAMEADDTVLQVLKELSDIGVQLLIDDFGTGYSNLARLKSLPFSGIKIDRTFVSDLPDSAPDREIFRATHAMAQALGLSIVVEGIENDAQADFVDNFDVALLQGYRYGKPVPAKKLKRYLR